MRAGRLIRDRTLFVLGLAIASIALADIVWFRWLERADHALADAAARIRAPRIPADPDIVVLDIDERSLSEMQASVGRFPWPRSVYGELIAELARQRAKAIVLDVELYEPDRMRPADDAVLNEAVAATDNTFFPLRLLEPLGPDDGVRLAEVAPALDLARRGDPPPGARYPIELPLVLDRAAWKRTGIVNFLPDADGTGRRYWIERDLGGFLVPSLPARVARTLGWHVPKGDATRDPPGRAMLITWPAGVAPHAHVPFVDVYEDLQRSARTRPAGEFAGRIVVVGSSASHLRDFRATPIAPLHSGVSVLATAIDNLKNGRELDEAPRAASLAVAAALFVPLFASLRRRHNVVRVFWMLLAATAAALVLASLAREFAGKVVYVGAALSWAWLMYFVAALRAYLAEQRAKEKREQVLARFLDPRVVRRLVAEGVTIEDFKSETRTITVLFSDIRGFTTLAETRPAEEVVAMLNRYFSMQAETVFRHGGTLDKFIGDAIMAFWNAPTDDPRHAAHAVACAIDMVDTLARFNAAIGGEGLDIGIGLHSGTAVVGFVGSARKLEYTAIGDTVNLASRVEGATKGVARILVTEATRARVGDGFRFEDKGEVGVKGRQAAVRLYSVEAGTP